MDYAQLPMLDNLAGKLARSGLGRLRSITDRLRKRNAPRGDASGPPERVLVVRLWGVGHTVMAGRALASLRAAWPDADITLLADPGSARVYEFNDLYDRTVVFDVDATSALPGAMRDLLTRLRKEEFDLAVDLDGLSRLAAFVTQRCGAKKTAGVVAAGEGDGGFTVATGYGPDASVADTMYVCARDAGGAEVPDRLVAPALREQDHALVDDLLDRHGVGPHDLLIGICMGGGVFAPQRRWPGEKFILLAQEIEEMAEYRTVFFGSAQEERYVTRHLKLMATPGINLSGVLSVRQLAAAMERMHCVVGNDGGAMHVAAAAGASTVTLYGPETAARVGRRNDVRHAAVEGDCDDRPCVSLFAMETDECLDGCSCMRNIPLDRVRAVLTDMLDHLADPEDPPWLAGETAVEHEETGP